MIKTIYFLIKMNVAYFKVNIPMLILNGANFLETVKMHTNF